MTLTADTIAELAFAKTPDGLLPAVVQHATDGRVLMLGYVNAESLRETFRTGLVTFYSRSKRRLWTKGEASGNTLRLVLAKADCDRDTVLFLVEPAGPTCHTGEDTCFDDADAKSTPYNKESRAAEAVAPSGKTEIAGSQGLPRQAAPSRNDDLAVTIGGEQRPPSDLNFLLELEQLLHSRLPDAQSESYTSRLLAEGVMKVAQKVGEEGVEMALEAVGGTDELFTEEAADLMYHYLLLLRAKGQRLGDVVEVLRTRH